MKIKTDVRNAIMIGGMCSLSYLAVYFARNILSAVSPQMIGEGVFTTEDMGSLSSVYFITYAVGQLINGAIGDKIKAKYMISAGLFLAGICNLIFSLFSGSWLIAYCAYAMTGFFLSMIYGPMTKVVSENTDPIYATRCSLGYTFASLFGSPLAGAAAVVLSWQGVFSASSITLAVMSILCFTVFSVFERRDIIRYNQFKRKKEQGSGIGALLEHKIVKFTLISIITGVVRTTVVFWLTTYLNQHLGFDSETSALIYTVATLVISTSAFVSVFMYEILKRNMDLTILISFSVSAASFLAAYFVRYPLMNIICVIFAILASNCASNMLWSRYCPSLRDTGMVSGATGFLDFCSYISAGVSSTVFANAVSSIGWSGLILVWFGLMAAGVVISLPVDKLRKKTE